MVGPRCRLTVVVLLAGAAAGVLAPVTSARSPSSIRVGVGEQDPAVFAAPAFHALGVKRTRYVVRSDVMRDPAQLARATAFARSARAAGVSVLLHVSTTDLRRDRGRRVPTGEYRRDVGRLVRHFRALGVRDFGAWNSANNASQETWDSPGHAVSYFQSMYRAVKLGAGPPEPCRSCGVVGLDLLDQAGAERYVDAFYGRLSPTWRARLSVIGLHNYSDVNRGRPRGTGDIIRAAHEHSRVPRFWLTESGAVARAGTTYPYNEARQARLTANVFASAKRYEAAGVRRLYAPSFFGFGASCDRPQGCEPDAGLVRPDGTPRPAYDVFRAGMAVLAR